MRLLQIASFFSTWAGKLLQERSGMLSGYVVLGRHSESHCSSERNLGTRRHGEMKQVAVAQSSCGKEEQMYPDPSLSWETRH